MAPVRDPRDRGVEVRPSPRCPLSRSSQPVPERTVRWWSSPALLLLVLVVAVYAASLGGGWVWDDWVQVADNPLIHRPLRLILGDIRAGTGSAGTDHYRPVVMLTHVPLQALLPGPAVERAFNLLLHLSGVLLVAAIARRLGAAAPAATAGAALLAVHPGSTEAVAWICGRHDLLPAVVFLGAWWAFLGRRDLLAGLLLAATPFCKETYLLVPACVALWMLGARRFSWPVTVLPALGVGAYVGLRHILQLPMPVGGFLVSLKPSLGAMGLRGVVLTLYPLAPDALPPFVERPMLGWLVLVIGLALAWCARGRPVVAGLTACLVLLVPAAQASRQLGSVGDRYFYVWFAGLSVALALALGSPRARRLAWALVLGLALVSAGRAYQWTSDARIFGTSYARDPDNAAAAFHLAYDLHVRQGDCAAAAPLYRQGMAADARAGNNLQACLVDLGQLEAAAALGPQLAERDPASPTSPANTARALVGLGRLDEAEHWAMQAVTRAPERCPLWLLLGNIRGQRGALDGAAEAFGVALERGSGCESEARQGLLVVERLRAASEEAPAD